MSGSEGHAEDEGTLQQEKILKHECQICGEKFSTLQQLQNRQASHSDKPLHLCHKCGKTFETSPGLSRHLETHLEDQPHSCHICNKTFQFPMDLKQHMETHTDRKRHECAICSHRFRTERYLKVHTEKCHSTNPTPQQEYQSGTELQEHTDRVHPEGTFECSDCCKRFNTPVGLNDHFTRTHIQFEENVQTVKSIEEGDFNIHLKTVLKPSLYLVECSICFKIFGTLSDLQSHNRHEHGESDDAVKENISDSEVDIDSAQFPFECQPCYQGFSTMEELKAHNEERHPSTCTKCGITFTRVSDLNRHIRHKQCKADQYVETESSDSSESSDSEEDTASEQEEKLSHVCPTCKIGYSSLQELNAHCEKMHPVKVIQCPKCGDKFVRKADVNRHIRQNMCKAQEGTDQNVQIVQEGTNQNVENVQEGTVQNNQERTDQNVQNVQDGTDLTVQEGTDQTVQNVQEGTDQTLQEGTVQNVQEGTDQKVQEGTDQTVQNVQEGTDQTVQEGTVQNVQEGTDQNVQEGTAQNVQEGKRKRDDDREEDDEPGRKKSTKSEMSR